VNRDPDERAQPDGPDGAADEEFEAIVAGWRAEGHVPQWPNDPQHPRDVVEPSRPEPARQPPDAPTPAAAAREADVGDHFVPPEPPPLPRLGPPALVGLVLLALGLVLVTAPGWVGIPEPYGLPLGLVALAAGLGWLVLRLWPDPPSRHGGDGDDDGAVV
jgi:hypothetical protein